MKLTPAHADDHGAFPPNDEAKANRFGIAFAVCVCIAFWGGLARWMGWLS